MNEEAVQLLPPGGGYLLIEFGDEDRAGALRQARALADQIERDGGGAVLVKLFEDPSDEKKVWEVRESGLGATALVKELGLTWEGWEDTAVAPERLGAYLRDFRALLDSYGYDGAFYGHFGQGLVHVRINFDLETRDGIAKYLRFLRAATELVVRFGGSISGEHGDGQARGALLSKMFSPRLMQAFHRFRDVGPGWPHEPGAHHRRLSAEPEPGARHRLGAARTRDVSSAFPKTTARSIRRRSAAWAWGNVGSRAAARCAPATWSPARRSTPREGARAPSSR